MHRYLLALTVCMALLSGACRSTNIEINVLYDRIAGLVVDDRVMFDGRGAGVVESIEYARDGTYAVQLSVDKGFSSALTEHAQFFIVDDPERAGGKAVEIRLLRSGGRLLSSGASVQGAYSAFDVSRKLQKDIESGVLYFKGALEKFGRDIQTFAESKEYHDLKRSLEGLAEEMARKEKAARETVKRQWLPKIQRELDDLRKRLKQLGRENEMAPLEEQVERLRRI